MEPPPKAMAKPARLLISHRSPYFPRTKLAQAKQCPTRRRRRGGELKRSAAATRDCSIPWGTFMAASSWGVGKSAVTMIVPAWALVLGNRADSARAAGAEGQHALSNGALTDRDSLRAHAPGDETPHYLVTRGLPELEKVSRRLCGSLFLFITSSQWHCGQV